MGERDWVSVLIFLLVHQIAHSQIPTIARVGTLGGSSSTAFGVNSAGKVVGNSYTADDIEEHAFLFSGGTISDLGTLGGTFSAAFGINKSGQIVGYSGTAGNAATHAFLLSGKSMTSLGTLGGGFSSATDINDAGQIIGRSTTANNLTHAFLYSGGVMNDLGTLGGSYSTAYALNSSGWVAGESPTANDAEIHAVLWTNGTILDLGTLGGTFSYASDLNDSGRVVGASATSAGQTHAFVYDGSVMQDIGTLGGLSSVAYAVNRSGQVIGDSYPPNSRQPHAFLYANGVMVDLETLGGIYSSSYAINGSGQIVGQSDTVDGFDHAFLWENGSMTDLNTLIEPDSGWELVAAFDISDGGHILGYGFYFGQLEWFLLSLNRTQLNNPPVANAGPDQQVECAGERTNVLLDGTGSSDPDGDALNYEWYVGNTLLGTSATLSISAVLGPHTITLKVTDLSGEWSQDSLNVLVADTTLTWLTCPQALTLSAGEDCHARVPDLLASAVAADNCTPVGSLVKTQHPLVGTLVSLGSHVVELTATDSAGNRSVCLTTVLVNDTTAPLVGAVNANPPILWPANRQMVPVTVTVGATDNCDPAPVCKIISISSSEPVTGAGDNTSPDWEVTGPLTANLRAENSKADFDRVYTLTIQCTDASGNSSSANVTVAVPRHKPDRKSR